MQSEVARVRRKKIRSRAERRNTARPCLTDGIAALMRIPTLLAPTTPNRQEVPANLAGVSNLPGGSNRQEVGPNPAADSRRAELRSVPTLHGWTGMPCSQARTPWDQGEYLVRLSRSRSSRSGGRRSVFRVRERRFRRCVRSSVARSRRSIGGVGCTGR